MTVATTPPPLSRPVSAQLEAISAMMWSPSTIAPCSSQMTTRSASPSSAMPMSAPRSSTVLARRAVSVEPQPRLMLKPSGSAPMAMTSAPSSHSTVGATL